MPEPDYIKIGYTRKTHGVAGELKVVIENKFLEDFMKNERIFIDIRGIKMPYFIVDVRGSQDLIMQLEEVESKEAAMSLQSREVFLRPQDLIPEHKREFDVVEEVLEYEHLTGFTIIDQTLGEIGVIDEVLDMPQQNMASLKYKGKECMIPLNKALITKIDLKGKRVTMDLPEGLVE
jgi:16S rRNA processing protein RimM